MRDVVTKSLGPAGVEGFGGEPARVIGVALRPGVSVAHDSWAGLCAVAIVLSAKQEASTAMTHKRKPTEAAPRPTWNPEPTRVLQVRVEPEDAFFKRVKRRTSGSLERLRAPAVPTVSFESVGALLAVLTPRRYELFQAVRQGGGFSSIGALAERVQRNRVTVSRDVRALAQAGLLTLSEPKASGRGKRTAVSLAAEKVKLTLVL